MSILVFKHPLFQWDNIMIQSDSRKIQTLMDPAPTDDKERAGVIPRYTKLPK